MPIPSSKDNAKNPPNSGLDSLFDDEVVDADDPLSDLDDPLASPKQLKELRKRAEDILEQKKLEQELNEYDYWGDDWDD